MMDRIIDNRDMMYRYMDRQRGLNADRTNSVELSTVREATTCAATR
jgi:hypothetical protein